MIVIYCIIILVKERYKFMLDLLQVLANVNDVCGGLGPIVSIIKKVVSIFHIVIPIILIAYGTLDLGKAVMASDDKQVKEAQGKLIKRCVYAVVIFLIPYLVSLVMGLVDAANTGGADTTVQEKNQTSYQQCWNQY